MSECQYLHFDVSQIHLRLVEVEVAFGTVFIIGKFRTMRQTFSFSTPRFQLISHVWQPVEPKPPKSRVPIHQFLWFDIDFR